MDKYTVTCEKCGGHDILTISSDRQVMYTEHTPIISARFRGDLKWGFECICGQDSRVAPQEEGQLEMLIRGGEHAIEAIRKTLTPKNELKFRMDKI